MFAFFTPSICCFLDLCNYIYINPHILLLQYYLNVLQQLLLAPADILQLLLLLWSEVVWHWREIKEKMKR